jgi:hypothetical protein
MRSLRGTGHIHRHCSGLAVEFAEEALDLAVVLLGFFEGGLDVLEGGGLVGLGDGASLVLAGAVVLDLLAGLFDLV